MDGKIDAEAFRHSLMTFGDKFSASEVDNAFGEFLIEDGMIDAVHLKGKMAFLFSYIFSSSKLLVWGPNIHC